MRSYELISHVADVRLKVEGDTLEELFTAALEGMNHIAKKEEEKIPCDLVEKFSLASIDSTVLLVDFLSEILTSMHIDKAIYTEVKFDELTEKMLKVKIRGHKVESFEEDIKAVTYHEAEIKKNEKGNLEVIIVFDI